MIRDRKEYYKNYRLKHKEQYRKYSKKYRENNLTTYQRLKQENKELKDYIKELEGNSGVLVSQVESWSKTADIYLEKNKKLHKKNYITR